MSTEHPGLRAWKKENAENYHRIYQQAHDRLVSKTMRKDILKWLQRTKD